MHLFRRVESTEVIPDSSPLIRHPPQAPPVSPPIPWLYHLFSHQAAGRGVIFHSLNLILIRLILFSSLLILWPLC